MLRFLLLMIPLPAAAAEMAPPEVSAGTYVQTALALGIIVALLLGMAWLARKLTGGKGFGQGGMKIIGGVALGPRERVVLLEVGEDWLVIGIVPGQIRTLHRLPKDPSISASTGQGTADKPFSAWLQGIAERRKHD